MSIKKTENLDNQKKPLFSDSFGKYTLVSLPWCTKSEQARWSLDLHKSDYLDVDLPWGFHFYELADISPRNMQLPLLFNHKKEKFTSLTQITMYLYSQAFSGRVRLYSSTSALLEQEYFDEKLASASRTIYLDALLSNSGLSKKFIVEGNHLATCKAINRFTWPFLKYIYWIYFGLYSKNAVKKAWVAVEECFKKVESICAKTPSRKFLLGDSITAADISFASHASPLLLPGNLGINLPKLDEMTPEYQQNVLRLRDSIAGKFAITLYSTERGNVLAKKLDRKDAENEPEWSKPGKLPGVVRKNILMIIIPYILPFIIQMDSILRILMLIIVTRLIFHLSPLLQDAFSRLIILWNFKEEPKKIE